MSEQTNRQAYVFLDCSPASSDITVDGDQYSSTDYWFLADVGLPAYRFKQVRRPIATPEQTDGLTVWDELAYDVCIHLNNGHHNEATEVLMKWQAMMKARAGK